MAKSSESTVLHACNAQRGKNGQWLRRVFHHNSREHLLLRQSERGAWRRPAGRRRQKMMMRDTKPIIEREGVFRCRVYLERDIESKCCNLIQSSSAAVVHDTTCPLAERLTTVNFRVTWAWRHFPSSTSPLRLGSPRSFLSEEMLALVVASSIRGRVPNAAMMMYVCRCAMWISPELSRPE